MPTDRKKKSVEPGISDDAVEAKTGKRWAAWFEQLDRAGASQWPHARIANHLHEAYGLSGWWSQMVAVTYEQARGLRDKHEQKDGYQIQRERTLTVPAERAWRAWTDPNLRKQWLPEAADAAVRLEKETEVRLDWGDGRTRVLLGVRPKGEAKCSVGVQQSKLPDAKAAERAKAFWAERLDRLKGLLAD